MKFIFNSRQSKEYLKIADAIFVKWNDRKQIIDLGHDYKAEIILDFLPEEESDLKSLKTYRNLCPNGFTVLIHNLSNINFFKENDIGFYFDYHIKTYYELIAISKLEPKYIQLDAPLFFEIDNVKKYNIPILLNPTRVNVSVFDVDATTGTWVRPEDIKNYEPCAVYFEEQGRKREQALYKLYYNGLWPGMLNILIPEIETQSLNRLLTPDFGEHRLNCGQRCLQDGHCHICKYALKLASMQEEINEWLTKDIEDI